jgi:NADH:ubiquinone oxidoreductase subunit
MEAIKSKIVLLLEKTVLKFSGKRSKLRYLLYSNNCLFTRNAFIKYKDDGLGREIVGKDKFGNKYYQYYSFHGLPTRRVILYKFFDTNRFNIDPHFIDWLYKRELLPPTAAELEKLYLDHD